eukprot:1195810-Prorocentrum_minimum.AAC.6
MRCCCPCFGFKCESGVESDCAQRVALLRLLIHNNNIISSSNIGNTRLLAVLAAPHAREHILRTDQSDAGNVGIFSGRTNRMQEAWVYSQDGPIGRRKRPVDSEGTARLLVCYITVTSLPSCALRRRAPPCRPCRAARARRQWGTCAPPRGRSPVPPYTPSRQSPPSARTARRCNCPSCARCSAPARATTRSTFEWVHR